MKFLFFNLTVVSAFYYLVIATPQGEIPSATDIVSKVVQTAASLAPKVSNIIKKEVRDLEASKPETSVSNRKNTTGDPVPPIQVPEVIDTTVQGSSEEIKELPASIEEDLINERHIKPVSDGKMQQHVEQQVSDTVNRRHKLQKLSDEMEDLYLSTLKN